MRPANRALLLLTGFAAAFITALPAPSMAQDYHRRTLVGWPDPFTPPRVTTRCVKWASTTGVKCKGLKCRRTAWKTCIGHAYDTRYMRCELVLRVPAIARLPVYLQNAARNVASVCAGVAVATAASITPSTSPAAAIAILKPTFLACVQSRGGQALAALSLTVEKSCGWHK